MRADVIVIGGGIVGLATARELLLRRPGLDVVVLEKEAAPGTHQTGHNSGVLHAGIYYPPGSLKARLCRAGKESLERFASEQGIPFERCGKVVVAVTEGELDGLERLRERADANGIPGLEVLGPAGLRDREPHAAGLRALWSPTTGIIDFRRVALAVADDIRQRGGRIELGAEVVALTPRAAGVVVATPGREHQAGGVVTCAGVHADRFGAGSGPGEPIIPFRGDYCTLTPDARPLVRSLIYPVPDPRLPFLGVHLTRRIDGEVLAGPNAVLALAREGYRRRDIDLRQVAAVVGYRGFRRLARR
ncbi:MAG: L-2-hydroxyglutarate oxidase, partial [Acidimicrobiales bacterium]